MNKSKLAWCLVAIGVIAGLFAIAIVNAAMIIAIVIEESIYTLLVILVIDVVIFIICAEILPYLLYKKNLKYWSMEFNTWKIQDKMSLKNRFLWWYKMYSGKLPYEARAKLKNLIDEME